MHGVDTGDDTNETYYLGSNPVRERTDGTYRISVPQPARQALDLSPSDSIWWAYEQTVGFLILATDTLSNTDDYTNVGKSVKLGDEADVHRVTIAAPFFRGADETELTKQATPPEAQVHAGEERHFVARERFLPENAGDDPVVCYLLTQTQLETRLAHDGEPDWNDAYESRPRFLR